MVNHQQQTVSVLTKFEECVKTLSTLQGVLLEVKSRPRSATQEINEEMDNIYYVVPHIAKDYEFVRGQSLPVPKIIDVLVLWTESVETATYLNRQKLNKSKRLFRHIEESLAVCVTVASVVKGVLENHRSST